MHALRERRRLGAARRAWAMLGAGGAYASSDWRTQTQARARVRLAIEDTLDYGLPRAYTPELYQFKCTAVFEHIYERYGGANPPC